jgi:transaldolase
VFDHGEIKGDQVRGHYADASATMDQLAGVGIDYDDVVKVLEDEGVDKFEKSWGELLESVTNELERARAAQEDDK